MCVLYKQSTSTINKKMSSTELNTFLNALQMVKEDYTCGVCSKLCENPVTLSTCFHIICSEHFEGLKSCPDCKVSLKGCQLYAETTLGPAIQSTKTLVQIFEKLSPSADKSRRKTLIADKSLENKKRLAENTEVPVKNQKSSKGFASKATNSIKRTRRANNDQTSDVSNEKENSSQETRKLDQIAKPNMKDDCDSLNMSYVSTLSFKVNKAIQKKNHKGETELHVACRLGKVDKVTELLNQGANTNTKDNAGWTPLHEVVQNGHLDLVKLLLQHNTLINVPGQSNETPLHEAIRYGHKDIVEELVRNGADINAKNCKGETPLQLASEKMKKIMETASENIIQTQSVNIAHISNIYSELDFEDIRVFCTSQFRTVHNKLKVLSKHHENLHIEAKITKKTTHLIVDAEDDGTCLSNLDVLQGIVSGLWILTSKWVSKSTINDLEPFETYEVTGLGTTAYNGPKNARCNKYKQFPGIFNGCHFYLHNFTTNYEITKRIVLTKAIITKLITDAGGIVLRRVPNPELIPESEKLVPYHAKKDGRLTKCSHFIIFKDTYEPTYNMEHLKALPVAWLIECIGKYELCEP